MRTASSRWRCGCSKYRPRAGISQSGTIFAGMMLASTSYSSWGAGQSLALGVRASKRQQVDFSEGNYRAPILLIQTEILRRLIERTSRPNERDKVKSKTGGCNVLS